MHLYEIEGLYNRPSNRRFFLSFFPSYIHKRIPDRGALQQTIPPSFESEALYSQCPAAGVKVWSVVYVCVTGVCVRVPVWQGVWLS